LEFITSNTLFEKSNWSFFCMKTSSSPGISRHRTSSQKVDSVCPLLKEFFARSRGQQGLSSYLPFLFESKYIRTEGILKYNGKVLEGISSDQKCGVGTPLHLPSPSARPFTRKPARIHFCSSLLDSVDRTGHRVSRKTRQMDIDNIR
jgi:hypothetical protein